MVVVKMDSLPELMTLEAIVDVNIHNTDVVMITKLQLLMLVNQTVVVLIPFMDVVMTLLILLNLIQLDLIVMVNQNQVAKTVHMDVALMELLIEMKIMTIVLVTKLNSVVVLMELQPKLIMLEVIVDVNILAMDVVKMVKLLKPMLQVLIAEVMALTVSPSSQHP
jgi:hypothetical protein